MKTKKQILKRVNISIPDEVIKELRKEAKIRGIQLGTYCKSVLVRRYNAEKFID